MVHLMCFVYAFWCVVRIECELLFLRVLCLPSRHGTCAHLGWSARSISMIVFCTVLWCAISLNSIVCVECAILVSKVILPFHLYHFIGSRNAACAYEQCKQGINFVVSIVLVSVVPTSRDLVQVFVVYGTQCTPFGAVVSALLFI